MAGPLQPCKNRIGQLGIPGIILQMVNEDARIQRDPATARQEFTQGL
jgi:hypothetical protein